MFTKVLSGSENLYKALLKFTEFLKFKLKELAEKKNRTFRNPQKLNEHFHWSLQNFVEVGRVLPQFFFTF